MSEETIWEKFFYKMSEETWFHIRVIINKKKGKFDVYIDNEKLVDSLALQDEIVYEEK